MLGAAGSFCNFSSLTVGYQTPRQHDVAACPRGPRAPRPCHLDLPLQRREFLLDGIAPGHLARLPMLGSGTTLRTLSDAIRFARGAARAGSVAGVATFRWTGAVPLSLLALGRGVLAC